MMKYNNLTKTLLLHTSNFGLGAVLPKLIGFLLIPLYTLYLTPEDYGLVELYASLSMFLLVIFKVGIPGSISRLYFDYQDDIKTYISTIFIFFFVVTVIFSIITYYLGKSYFEYLIPDVPFHPFFILIIFTVSFQIFSLIQKQIIIVRQESKFSMILNIISTIIRIGSVLIFIVFFNMKAMGFILAGFIASSLLFLQVLYYFRRELILSFNWNYLRESMKWGVYIFPSHLMSHFSPLLTNIILINYNSLASLGIVSIAIRFTSLLFILSHAFKNAYLPLYYSYRKENSPEMMKRLIIMSKNIWILACILFLCISLLFPIALRFFTPISYHEASYLIGIISIGFLFNLLGILFGIEIFYMKKVYYKPMITFISISSNIIFVLLFINHYGMYAIAVGMSLYWIIYSVSTITISRKLYLLPIDTWFYFTSLILCLLFSSFYIIMDVYGINDIYKVFVSLIIITIFTFIYKSDFNFKGELKEC